MAHQSRKRIILKTIVWRMLASFATMAVVLTLTGELRWAASVGILDMVIKLVLYYFHERAWEKVRWGTEPLKGDGGTDGE